jgi:hypothetical protein
MALVFLVDMIIILSNLDKKIIKLQIMTCQTHMSLVCFWHVSIGEITDLKEVCYKELYEQHHKPNQSKTKTKF